MRFLIHFLKKKKSFLQTHKKKSSNQTAHKFQGLAVNAFTAFKRHILPRQGPLTLTFEACNISFPYSPPQNPPYQDGKGIEVFLFSCRPCKHKLEFVLPLQVLKTQEDKRYCAFCLLLGPASVRVEYSSWPQTTVFLSTLSPISILPLLFAPPPLHWAPTQHQLISQGDREERGRNIEAGITLKQISAASALAAAKVL